MGGSYRKRPHNETPSPVPESIHEAVRAVYRAFTARTGYGLEYLAGRLGRPVWTMYQWAEAVEGDEARRRIPAQDAVLLTNETGDRTLLRTMAHLTGCYLIEMPDLDDDADTRALAGSLDLFNRMVQEYLAAHDPAGPGGRRVTRAELEQFEAAATSAVEAIHGLCALARAEEARHDD